MSAGVRRFSVQVDETLALNAVEWGQTNGPLLVLLHGGGANLHWWDHLAPDLARTHRVVGLDFRGHGDSSYPETLLSGAFGLDLEALIADLGHPAPILVGHSMGAHVAFDHAARHSDVRGLVLIDPSRGGTRRSRRAARLALALRRTYESQDEAIERFRFVPSASHCAEALRRSIAGHSVHREADGRYAFKFDPRWFGVPAKPPPDPAAVSCPTLVIRGAESQILSEEGAKAFVAEIPEARLLEIQGAGHHVLLDEPAALLAGLRAWLDDSSATP